MKEENLKIYNQLREVPKEAQKPISGGRLNGMTDIKPMWRIEKLTEVFGVCGFGWKAPIVNKEIIEGANGEKIAIVDIELYINRDGEWSEPIAGTGGSSFVAKEKQGLYTNDECFKMAYTDALSVACKSLGMGADVYWGDSKYDTEENDPTEEDAKNYVLTFGKYKDKKLIDVLNTSYKSYLMEKGSPYIKKCIEILTGQQIPTEEELDERVKLMSDINDLERELNIDHDDVLERLKVESLSQLTNTQLIECKNNLEKIRK